MRLRNVLNLITVLAWTPRDVDSVDEYGIADVFLYCPCGREHRCFPCDDPDYDSMADDVLEYERKDEYWWIVLIQHLLNLKSTYDHYQLFIEFENHFEPLC